MGDGLGVNTFVERNGIGGARVVFYIAEANTIGAI